MRVMMLVIPKDYPTAEPGTMPPADLVEKMMEYNTALRDAGVLLSLEGLHPPSMGARVEWANGNRTTTYGPFPGVSETVGGFWMLQVESLDEAIAWAEKVPNQGDGVIEIRRIQEFADFPEDVQAVAVDFIESQPKPVGIP